MPCPENALHGRQPVVDHEKPLRQASASGRIAEKLADQMAIYMAEYEKAGF
jgi:hypothetical protein